jgi:streptomycin 6-kinase
MFEVPDYVRRKAVISGALSWLDDLPAQVVELEREWEIEVGAVYGRATDAFVAEARTAAGDPAVLKLHIPRGHAAAHEITALQLCGGTGCVRMLRHDRARGALLLERLGPALGYLALPLARRQEILCTAASRVWRPAPGSGLPTGERRAVELVDYITTTWESLDRPCSERAIDHAVACAGRRMAAHDDERAVLVHGDVHQWNALRSGPGFTLVDPDGVLAEPEFDLGVLMREDPVELCAGDPHARARMLAARTGLDAGAIWEWGVVERLSDGLMSATIDVQPLAGQKLAAASFIAKEYAGRP